MNAITVERNAISETATITAFMLTEADGGGSRDIERGYVASEAEALIWKGNNAYRGYRPVTKTITVHRTAQSFMTAEEVARARAILSGLSDQDLELLRKYPELLRV